MINISNLILIFRDFLLLGFPSIQKLDLLQEQELGSCSFQEDYAQIFLEQIIERFSENKFDTPVSLPPYALDGASIYPDSDRAFFPERHAITHQIICLPKNSDYFFDFFSAPFGLYSLAIANEQ